MPTDLPSDRLQTCLYMRVAEMDHGSVFGSTLFRDFAAETFDKSSKRSGLIENKSIRPIRDIGSK